MSVEWIKDADTALGEVRNSSKAVLLDFSAAPA